MSKTGRPRRLTPRTEDEILALKERPKITKRNWYKRNQKKVMDAAAKWKIDNPQKTKKMQAISMAKYRRRLSIESRIDDVGEAAWLVTASDEDFAFWVDFKQKAEKRNTCNESCEAF
jgi:hypothetical protein